jgi:hypothetical protein
MLRFLASALTLLAVSSLSAQGGPTANTLALEPGTASPPAALGDLAWLAGHWRGEGLGGVSEEMWSAPEAGSMMGMYRLMQDGAVVFYELMTIQADGASLVLTIKHFNADLTGWEERDEMESFPLVRLTPTAAYFDELTIRQVGPDAMEAFVVVNGRDGSRREEGFRYTRVRDP